MLDRLQEYQVTILLNMKNHFMYFFFSIDLLRASKLYLIPFSLKK